MLGSLLDLVFQHCVRRCRIFIGRGDSLLTAFGGVGYSLDLLSRPLTVSGGVGFLLDLVLIDPLTAVPHTPSIAFRHHTPSIAFRHHNPSIAFRHLPPWRQDVVNYCLEFDHMPLWFTAVVHVRSEIKKRC